MNGVMKFSRSAIKLDTSFKKQGFFIQRMILDLAAVIKQTQVVRFTPRPLKPRKSTPSNHPLSRRLSGPQTQYGQLGTQKRRVIGIINYMSFNIAAAAFIGCAVH
jgi:hypothetical protein